MSRELAGKTVIVTGGAGGIGRATALVLAAAGANVALSDRPDAAGEAAAAAIRDRGGEASWLPADLADEAAIESLVARTVERYGRLDGAFNNAGVEQASKPLHELSTAEWERALRIDLTAVFWCIKYQVRAMLAAGGGAIVNAASSLGQVAIRNASEYVAAKHGVVGLTRAAAADYGARGVRVNAVLPGVTLTPMIARLVDEPSFATFFDRLKERHPIGRFGQPHEIGEAVRWLLGDAASFVNGATVAVDGGYLAV